MGEQGEITLVLERLRAGETDAEAELMRLVYGELRKIAANQLRRERANHTLQPTALVHETYLRLIGKQNVGWENRAHFFGAAARAMRHILVDHARAARAQRRGAGLPAVEMTELVAAIDGRVDEILAVDEALDRLNQISPRQKTIVEMRFYAGFTEEEIAEILHLNVRQIKRDWATAKAWLHGEMQRKPSGDPAGP
jgi:RNA polymerase sigma-70 factor (ECF subfamily)